MKWTVVIVQLVLLTGFARATGLDGNTAPPQPPPEGDLQGYEVIHHPSQACPSGCKGFMGDEGNPGPRGPMGRRGLPGAQGIPGFFRVYADGLIEGKRGSGIVLDSTMTGPHGPPGLPGGQGPPGSAGSKGAKGGEGPPGQAGHIGSQGPSGMVGDNGAAGEDGLPGNSGNQGEIGPRGQPGDLGARGALGDKGYVGEPGYPGKWGPDGASGEKGIRGDKGDLGETGIKGQPGFKGLKGDPGPFGADGDQGSSGNDGTPGARGPKGQTGDKGDVGNLGNDGSKGGRGAQGPYIEKIGVNETKRCSMDVRGRMKFDPYVKKLYFCNGITWQCIKSKPCQRECQLSDWEHWSDCSVTCGVGTQSRSRRIFKPNCPAGTVLLENQACNAGPCTCPRPSDSNEARVISGLPTYAIGEEAHWQCAAGFRLSGGTRSVCMGNGQFSASPTCERVTCAHPGTPQNGQTTATASTESGQSVSFRCNDGYRLSGAAQLICQADGKWDDTLPGCEAIMCDVLGVPANGMRSGTNRLAGSTVTYSCENGYHLAGEEQRTCDALGQWSDSEPTCVIMNCGNPGVPENGARDGNTFSFLSMTTFKCDVGYRLSGSRQRVCQANGMWSGERATCSPVMCAEPVTTPDLTRIGEDFTVGKSVTFICQVGSNTQDAGTITCLARGIWSAPVPKCPVIGCCDPSPPVFGNVAVDSGIATYLCDAGYTLTGVASRTCQSTGLWTATPPTCEPTVCADPGVPLNGQRLPLFGVFRMNNQASFSCDTGYRLVGSSAITCLDNGLWSEPRPVCQPIVCPDPGTPVNGQRIGDDFSFGNSLMFSCDDGFTLSGSVVRTCQLNSQYDGVQPICIPDCQVSLFNEWSQCSVTCGLGSEFRTRTVIRNPGIGGKQCPLLREDRSCSLGPCVLCQNRYTLNQVAYLTPNTTGPFAADIVVVIEQSNLLQKGFEEIIRSHLSEIEQELITRRNTGTSTNLHNRYTLVGFGRSEASGERCAHFLVPASTPAGVTSFTYDQFAQTISQIPVDPPSGLTDGYEAILYAIRNAQLRHAPNIAHNLIFISNSSRSASCGSNTREEVASALSRYGFTPNFVLDHRMLLLRDKEEEVFGVRALLRNASRLAYIQSRGGSRYQIYSDEQYDIDYNPGFGNINQAYTQLALELGGVVWNMNNFMKQSPLPSEREGFKRSFIDIKSQEVETTARACKVCTCEDDGQGGRFACQQELDENYCKCRAQGKLDNDCERIALPTRAPRATPDPISSGVEPIGSGVEPIGSGVVPGIPGPDLEFN